MTKKNAEKAEAVETMRGIVKPGDTVYTVLRHVSRSGMKRLIDLHVIQDGCPRWISSVAARAAGFTFDQKRESICVGGCGMDMGFHLVYELSARLWPDGFGCIGETCPSNDHSNGDRDYTPHGHRKAVHVPNNPNALEHWHSDGGYALRQRWI